MCGELVYSEKAFPQQCRKCRSKYETPADFEKLEDFGLLGGDEPFSATRRCGCGFFLTAKLDTQRMVARKKGNSNADSRYVAD